MRFRPIPIFILFLLLILSNCSTKNTKDYQLKTSVSPSNAGTVSPASGYFNSGDSLTITASPNEHWVFDRWEGTFSRSDNPANLEVNQDLDITAMFTERTYPLNLEISGEGTVSEQIIQRKSNEYPNETLVELTANPSDGWHFSEWSGDVSGAESQKEIMISGETNVTAKFVTDMIKTIGGSERDTGSLIFQTSDGGFILTGSSSSKDGDFSGLKKGTNYAFVMKIDASGNTEWIKSFSGSDKIEGAGSIIQTQDGGYVITGNTSSNKGDFSNKNRGKTDIFVIKLSSSGNIEWINTFGGSQYDSVSAMTQTPDNSIFISGSSLSNDSDFQDLNRSLFDNFLIKLTSTGDLVWLKTYGGSGSDYVRSMSQTNDGGVVLTGWTESDDGDFAGMYSGIDDAYVMKINSNGDLEWIEMISGNYLDRAESITTTQDGDFVITGYTSSNDGDFPGSGIGEIQKLFIAKVDESGSKEWVQTYDGDVSIIRGTSVIESDNGDISLIAYSNSNNETYHPMIKIDERIMVMKFNSSGIFEWDKIINGNNDDGGSSIVQSDDGIYYVTGSSNSTDSYFTENKGERDIFLMKLNDDGELIPFE